MKRILLLTSLIAFNVFAADFIKGSGQFISEDGDSHDFIKKQLIHEGIKSIVSIELENLKLNKELFWQKYNESLAKKNAEIEQNLKELLKITEESDRKLIDKFQKKLRYKKLILRKTFASMDDMLPKYAVRKMSRSQKNPRYRYVKLEGVVDKNLLTKTYYRLIRGVQTSDYGSLFLNINFQLNGVTYSELGIDNENDFEGEVSKNWLDWFSQNKPANIANTEILSEDKLEKLQSYLNLPSEKMLLNIPEVFVNSLLLELEVNIRKTKFNKKLNEYQFEYEGFGFLKDLQTNLVVNTYRFVKTEKSYKLSPDINIANLVANHVYHMAKGSFPGIIRNIKDMTPISEIKRVTLTDFKNINEINTLLKMMESRGVKFSLRTKLESISQHRADVIIYFDGEFTEVKSFFSSLQSAKNDLSFDIIETDNALGIKFNRVIEKL